MPQYNNNKKKIFINASTVLFGGGLSVAVNIIKTLNTNFPNFELCVVAPDSNEYRRLNIDNITFVPIKKLKRFTRFYFDHFYINKLIKQFNPDILFSLGNIPTPIKGFYQINLFDNPFTSANNLKELNLTLNEKLIHKIRNIAFFSRLKFVDRFVVQTRIQKELLAKKIKNKKDIQIIPNTPIYIDKKESLDFVPDKSIKYFLAFSYYYPHKNLEILIDLARIFKKQNKKQAIVLTIEASQDKRAEKLLNTIKNEQLTDYIFSIGAVKTSQIESLYSVVDAMILPSLLESFSSTYSDSMKYEKPIFTSDKDFAREICDDVANYFDPKDAINIFDVIEGYYNLNLTLQQEKIAAGKQRVANLKSWESNLELILIKEN